MKSHDATEIQTFSFCGTEKYYSTPYIQSFIFSVVGMNIKAFISNDTNYTLWLLLYQDSDSKHIHDSWCSVHNTWMEQSLWKEQTV